MTTLMIDWNKARGLWQHRLDLSLSPNMPPQFSDALREIGHQSACVPNPALRHGRKVGDADPAQKRLVGFLVIGYVVDFSRLNSAALQAEFNGAIWYVATPGTRPVEGAP